MKTKKKIKKQKNIQLKWQSKKVKSFACRPAWKKQKTKGKSPKSLLYKTKLNLTHNWDCYYFYGSYFPFKAVSFPSPPQLYQAPTLKWGKCDFMLFTQNPVWEEDGEKLL